jgi:hypothetical protein
VVVHVDAEVLASPEAEGRCCVENGPALSAETARRIACDAATVPLVEDGEGEALSVGRKSRRVSRALWRALRSRDRTCAFPGCERSGWLAVHHVNHWASGGETSQDNLILLCKSCHWRVHEGGFSVKGKAPDALAFFDPNGRRLTELWEPPELPADPVAVLKTRHADSGLEIDPETGDIEWWGEPMDLEMAVDELLTPEQRQPWQPIHLIESP